LSNYVSFVQFVFREKLKKRNRYKITEKYGHGESFTFVVHWELIFHCVKVLKKFIFNISSIFHKTKLTRFIFKIILKWFLWANLRNILFYFCDTFVYKWEIDVGAAGACRYFKEGSFWTLSVNIFGVPVMIGVPREGGPNFETQIKTKL